MLVTNLDGTQTVGWSDASALFASQPPTITSPPYTELEFPLYLKPRSEAYADVVDAVVRSLRQPSTPLNSAFFSRDNVDGMHREMQRRIADSLGLSIDRQSDWNLLLLMRRTYLESANNWPADVGEELARLNAMVLQEATESVSRNIAQYMTYRSTIAQPEIMPDPADSVTSTPYPMQTGTPLRPNLNSDFERSLQGFMSTREPVTYAPVLSTGTPQQDGLWTTAPPRETSMAP